MKKRILSFITTIALSACLLNAESIEIQDETELLRQEIIKHELIVAALKEKLAALGEENVFVVSITSEGLSTRGKPISLKALEKVLTELPDDAKILIRAESTISHNDLASVIELCSKAGLKNIALSKNQA
ncbi:MAG: biopolymer transporter ExbD [Verrucomicrobiota bacterium]